MGVLPKSYHVQDGCANCLTCFVLCEQDEDTKYYCAKNGDKRPLCGTCHTDEDFFRALEKKGLIRDSQEYHDEFNRMADAWTDWYTGREVQPNGMCSEYKPRKKHETEATQ